MRHLHVGRKLGVNPSHRKAMLRSLTLALIESETIKTTPARAKELRWYADRVITLAKRGDVASRRQLVKLLGSTQTFVQGENRIRMAIERIQENLLPRFKDRHGGYTQILRLAKRRAGDNAEMCVMRYIPVEDDKKSKDGDKSKKAQKPVKKEAKASDKPAKQAKSKTVEAPQDKPAKAKKKDEKGKAE